MTGLRAAADSMTMYLDDKGKLSAAGAGENGVRRISFRSEQAGSLYRVHVHDGVLNTYMTEDQRFAAERPDVLVYKTEPLDHD